MPAGDLDGDRRADRVGGGDNALSLLLFSPDGGPALRRAVSAASDTAIVAPSSLATIYSVHLRNRNRARHGTPVAHTN